MNQKPNKHKRINFNTTTMASLGVHSPSPLKFSPPPPPPSLKFIFLLRSPPPSPNYCGLKFLGPPPILGGSYHGFSSLSNIFKL